MKAIPLIATEIHFHFHSIVYDVKIDSDKEIKDIFGTCVCANDIKNKDLILKPTLLDSNNMQVVFTPANMVPHFYEAIFKKILHNLSEYKVEKDNIYRVGDIVGYLLSYD